MKYKDIALIDSRIKPYATKIAPLAIVTHTIWVNNQRTDDYTPDGTESFPYKSLQAAHDAVPSGTSASNIYEIRVKLGLPYTGDLTLTKDFITIAGDGGVTGAGYRGTVNSTSQHLTLRNISIASSSVINQIMAGHFLLELKDIHSNAATWNIEATGTDGEKNDSYVQVYGHNTIWTGGAINVTGIRGGVYLTGGAYYGIPAVNITDSLFDPGCSCVDDNVLNLEDGSTSELMNMKAARNTVHAKSGATVYADITALANLDNTFDFQEGSTLIKVSPASGIAVVDSGGYFTGTDVETVIQEIGSTLSEPFNTIYLSPLNTGVADGTIFHPFTTMAEVLAKISSASLTNVTLEMGTGAYSHTGNLTFDIPICIHGNGSTLTVSGTTTVNSVHQIYDLATTGTIVYAYTGSSRSTRNGGSINGTVTVQGGFPHFENLNYTGAMTITGGNPYFRGLTGGGRITLNGADAVLSVADCNMDMNLELANITVTAGQLIVNGGLFTNSGTVPNIVFNNTNLTDLTKAHMLSGVVPSAGISCGNALTVVAPTCIAALSGNVILPTPMIPVFGVGGGTAQVQTATVPIFATAYFAGLRFSIVISVSNTGATPTLNLNGLGAKTVKLSSGLDVAAGDMQIGSVADFIYDGTYLRLLNPQ